MLLYFDPSVHGSGLEALNRRDVVLPGGVEPYLDGHPDSVLVSFDPDAPLPRFPCFDSNRYDSWRVAWDLLDYLSPEDVGPYLGRHPKSVLVEFEYSPVDEFRYF